MNVQIHLLRYMSQRKQDDESSEPFTSSMKSSRRDSGAGSATIDHRTEAENYGLIILTSYNDLLEVGAAKQ